MTFYKGMIKIPAGSYQRGDASCEGESPVRSVDISSFWMDSTQVTNQAYQAFIDADGYDNPDYWIKQGWDFIQRFNIRVPNFWDSEYWNKPQQPVTGVCFWEAMAYAKFVGKTLPTEAQWEYAARGLDQRIYPWGNDEPNRDVANYAHDSTPSDLQRSTVPADLQPDNVSYFGVQGMAGNLFEWCLDNASDNYAWDEKGIDPIYITEYQDYHIVRGGSGLHNQDYLRCSSRDSYPPALRDDIAGFRCAINERLN